MKLYAVGYHWRTDEPGEWYLIRKVWINRDDAQAEADSRESDTDGEALAYVIELDYPANG